MKFLCISESLYKDSLYNFIIIASGGMQSFKFFKLLLRHRTKQQDIL